MYLAEKMRIGDNGFDLIMKKHGAITGSLKHDDEKSIDIYNDLRGALVPTAPGAQGSLVDDDPF